MIDSLTELPDSFLDKQMGNVKYVDAAVTEQPTSDNGSVKHLKQVATLDATKSVINNDPIFMVYTKDGPKMPANGNVNDDPPKKSQKGLWIAPRNDKTRLVWWIYTWPIKLLLTCTIPNPKTFRKLYPLTFFMCIMWIGLNAYMIVWMITVMGK